MDWADELEKEEQNQEQQNQEQNVEEDSDEEYKNLYGKEYERLCHQLSYLLNTFLEDTKEEITEKDNEHISWWSKKQSRLFISTKTVQHFDSPKKEKELCTAVTLKHQPCQNYALGNSQYCARHNPDKKIIPKQRSKMSNKPCEFIITRGARKNQKCGKNTPLGSDYCSLHSKNLHTKEDENKQKKEKNGNKQKKETDIEDNNESEKERKSESESDSDLEM